MTRKDGLPCKRCGTSEWYKSGHCVRCTRERSDKWQQDNPDGVSKRTRRWRQKNLDKVRNNISRWQKENPEKMAAKYNRRRTRKTKAGGSYTGEEFKTLCKQYDNRCLCCGKKKKLEFDHVIPVSKGGSSDISNGQPLCRSCNSSKGNKSTDYRTKSGIKRWVQPRLLD